MIYLSGMSHIWPVLRACALDPEGQRPLLSKDNEPSFVAWETKPEVLPGPIKVADLYVGNTSPHWGEVLAVFTSPTTLAFAPGFQRFLLSVDTSEKQNALFFCMYGEESIHASRTEYEVPYDYFLPNYPELGLQRHRQIIPLATIEAMMRHRMEKAIANFAAIRVIHPHLKIFSIICPPPVPSKFLDSSPKHYSPSEAALSGRDDELRLKNYYLYRQMLIRETDALNIISLLPPAETVGVNGLLLDEYVGDTVHGNLQYGARVVSQIRTVLEIQ